jgi:hypothetical protein
MPRPHRLPLLLAVAAGACALSAPAALAAAPQGVVLDRSPHGVRLVDAAHRVADVRIAAARGLQRGDVVTVRRGRAQVTGHARKVAFLARVVRGSANGALLRLDDGSTLKVAAPKPHSARARSAGAAADFGALAAGQALLVTLASDERGNVVLALKPQRGKAEAGDRGREPRGGAGDDDGDCGEDEYAGEDEWCSEASGDGVEVDGAVTALAVDGSSLSVAPDGGGAEATFPVADPGLLEGIEVGDDVAVTLDEDGLAIDVELLDWVDDPGDGDPGDDDGE